VKTYVYSTPHSTQSFTRQVLLEKKRLQKVNRRRIHQTTLAVRSIKNHRTSNNLHLCKQMEGLKSPIYK